MIFFSKAFLAKLSATTWDNSDLFFLFKDFIPLSGDRFFGEDKSVLTGFGTFDGNSLLINTSTEINRKNYTINYLKSNKNGWNIKQLINYQNYKRNYVEKWIHNNEIETNDLTKESSQEYEFSMNKKNNDYQNFML